jgi:Cu(I)/Ag(I) efflux system periplasmic protein CusF
MSKMKSRFRLPHAILVAGSMLIGMALVLVPVGALHAQGMGQMPGMGSAKQSTPVPGTGTVTAVNATSRKITLDHGPIPEIKWPAMKMEFAVAPSVDLSKVTTGDKVRFTLTGSGSAYTVQSINPSP